MKLSIVTLTYNHLERSTAPYIESLFKYTNPDEFELILVDNGSTDGTTAYLQELRSRRSNVRVVFNNENRGYSRGNNQGLELLDSGGCGEFVGLFNNDILFTPGWLESMCNAFDRDPRIGLASPRINTTARINSHNYLKLHSRVSARYRESFTRNITPYFCCVMMRRETFRVIGYLDERFSPAFYEDDDYSFRSLYAGFVNGYVNTAFVLHNHCTTSGGLPDRRRLLERNRRLFFDKHYLGELIYEYNASLRRPLYGVLGLLSKLRRRW